MTVHCLQIIQCLYIVGWKGLLVIAGNVGRPWLGIREIDPLAGACERLAMMPVFTDPLFPQVLISIQSMILCDEPYLNEPGWANSAGTPQSIACK